MPTIKECTQMSYPAAVSAIISQVGVQALDPGVEQAALKNDLEALDLQSVFEGQEISDKELAKCCVSGLWLAVNYLDRSHDISQDCPSQSGSYWHGIMHRREPDYSNAAYWFRKVGDHPLFAELPAAIAPFVGKASTDLQALAQTWDPFAFNAICEKNLNGGAEEGLCQSIQAIEWALLFDYCYQGAIA